MCEYNTVAYIKHIGIIIIHTYILVIICSNQSIQIKNNI